MGIERSSVTPTHVLQSLERAAWSSHDLAAEGGPVAPPTTDTWGRRAYAGGKRVFDVVLAALLLLILLPVILLTALAVRLDSRGPVLFRQRRIGCNGVAFEMLKFRTMTRDRRRRPGSPPEGVGERRRVHKSPGDPRVTRMGRFLRRSSLDELPQLWNVLKGDMSLIGPRPELVEIVSRYQPWQHRRHAVRPGITGWWQVNRCTDRLMHEATEMDLYYVENQSLKLDLIILFRTVRTVILGIGSF